MKLAICMVCRDVGITLPFVFKNINSLSKYHDITLIAEYDNCKDNTLQLLEQYKNDSSFDVIITTCINISPYRTERIAIARNKCLDILETLKDINFHIFIDPDDINIKPWNINLIDYYLKKNTWDSISFNGDNAYTKRYYYDKWALQIDSFRWHVFGFGENCIRIRDFMEKYITERLADSIREDIDCISSFNAFCIYRTEKFKGIRYVGLIEKLPLKFFKKQDINNTITFLHKNGIECKVEYPLYSSKNNYPHKDLPKSCEICEHIPYNMVAYRKGLSLKISKYNITEK